MRAGLIQRLVLGGSLSAADAAKVLELRRDLRRARERKRLVAIALPIAVYTILTWTFATGIWCATDGRWWWAGGLCGGSTILTLSFLRKG